MVLSALFGGTKRMLANIFLTYPVPSVLFKRYGVKYLANQPLT